MCLTSAQLEPFLGVEIPAQQLVPGDIVEIQAGDIVPADGRLLKAATLEVDESALTGESLPAAKGTDPVAGSDTPLGDRTDMVYMDTNVTRGAGEFVVTATGMATEVGHVSGMLAEEQAVKTPLTRQMDRLTAQILVIAGIALITSMALNLARGETFIAAFNAAVAFAIAAIPVGLPTVVTTILAWGTERLAKAGAIVKRLASTQTLGSTAAINSDKTGTLTLNQMTAVQMTVLGRRYAVEGKGYSTAGRITRVGGNADIPLDEFLVPMVLASDAVMILTDDNFSTIVKAIELGRGLYDNLARYIRFQIGGLFGYIGTFLGASIFNIAEGIPLLPLQTLWVSFTMLSIQSVGLGYSKPAAGLMDRPPLPPDQPILTRGRIVWLAFVGLLTAVGTLGVISWADQAHGVGVARTTGMVTFALFILSFQSSPRTNGTRRSPSRRSPTGRSSSLPARPSSCWSCPPC